MVATTSPELLRRLGGKAANLRILADAGLPVPPFAVLETDEYAAFVVDAGLDEAIERALAEPDRAAASDRIRAAFAAAPMSAEQRDRIAALVEGLTHTAVAVRSSATAEDLPGFSFAGQQDSFLGVSGLPAVLDAVVRCWSSAWTERAIVYRERNGVDHAGVAVAVVVQQMVDADAAGVLFTANPASGRRDETVIDAVRGLGEALVSGQVAPDNLVVETATGRVRERSVADGAPVLGEEQVRSLVAVGRRVAALYGEPQDVEWAIADGEVSVVQSRAITSLYPLPTPTDDPDDLPELWFSFGSFQGMLAPITPLGQDVIRAMLAGAALAVGRSVDWRTSRFAVTAGERIWLRLSPVLRTRSTRAVLLRVLPFVDPASAAILEGLTTEPGFAPRRSVPRGATAASLARAVGLVAPRVRANLDDAERGRRHVEAVCERIVDGVRAELDAAASAATPEARLAARVDAIRRMPPAFLPRLLPVFGPIMVPSMVMLAQLRTLAARTGLPDADALALQVLRALPGNVTTEMDLALADTARVIRADAASWGWFVETPPETLAQQYLGGNLPAVAQSAIGDFLASYGMRGLNEIDLGAPRWRDDPTPVMQSLRSYVDTDDARHPRDVHRAGQEEAGRSIRRLMDASTPANRERIRMRALRIRGMFGARETPKFTIVRGFGLVREALAASGAELVAAGRIAVADDVYFLGLDELAVAFDRDWRKLVAARREVRAAEERRAQVPRVLVSDGRAIYEGLGSTGDLRGSGVSPGVVEGPVRVVLDPRTARLQRGDILVCPGTDPSWTPLFLTAGGLITEVGGLMTHGSVVAREYGIPAVVGVHEATTRLTDGQRVRIDGTSGAIEVLDDAS